MNELMEVAVLHRGVIIASCLLLYATFAASEPLVFSAGQMQVDLWVAVEADVVSVSGRVIDLATKAPVVDAAVSIQVRNPYGGTVRVARTSTDSSGQFSDRFGLLSGSPVGTYTIYLTVSKEGFDDATALVTFEVASADWSITLSQTQVTIEQGSSRDVQLSINAIAGFSDHVRVDLSGLPPGVSYRLSPPIIRPNSTATLQVNVAPSTPLGSYQIKIQGTAGGKSHSAELTLIVAVAARPSPLLLLIALLVMLVAATAIVILYSYLRRLGAQERRPDRDYLAATRALVKLEELRAMGRVTEEQYQALKREYEEKIRHSLRRPEP